MKKQSIDVNRRKVILNLGYFAFYILAAIAIALVWGVDLKKFSLFVSSIIAVLGISFFAQWSILSNLTASIILFFYHPMRIGDRIRVLEKDYTFTGTIKDITGFYVYIITDENEEITLPNSYVLQRGIQMLEKKK